MSARTSVAQSLAALVACDQSYFIYGTLADGTALQHLPDGPASPSGDYANPTVYRTAPQFHVPTGYTVAATIERPEIGAKAVIYRNNLTNDTLVAFGGTDGLNAQDYVSNTQTFGWSQWDALKQPPLNGPGKGLLETLQDLSATSGTIQFAGQSLGGALAQYATVEYVKHQSRIAAENGQTYLPSNITLTTFNGLGAEAGLKAHISDYDSGLLAGLGQVAHYVIDNDLVSRLGGGHVGANGQVIKLDWTYLGGTSLGKPMDLGDSHRIETAFYTHLDASGAGLAAGSIVQEGSNDFKLVNAANAAAWAALLGNLGNNSDVTPLEAPFRLLAGVLSAAMVVDPKEINGVIQAYLETQHRAGKLTDWEHDSASYIDFGKLAQDLSRSPLSAIAFLTSSLAATSIDKFHLFTDLKGSEEFFKSWRDSHNGSSQFDPTGRWKIPASTATSFLAARTVAPVRRDPLILDLDGDGLETTGINPAAPILFDHDGDGVKTATGWVRSDDALLVLDRNGNGAIDNGTELFGDATNRYTGGKAADGFAALAQEDTNGDGKVDSLDARFANLRLWRDLNQDGISQAGELFTLASQGITALNVARTANATLLANGNQIADLGGFVRGDGTGGTLGAVEQLADINLASSPFHSQFIDSIPLTEAALNLADMQGAGMVRSLRQAASLPGAQGSALAAQLAAFAADTTRGGQLARLEPLLKAWSDTSTMATTATGAFAGVNLSVSFAGVANGSPAYQAWLDKLSILERFNGQTFLPVPAAGTTLAIDFHAAREAALDAAYEALKESVYDGLVMQTRLKPYLDQIRLSIAESGIALDFSAMEAALDVRYAADPANALVDRVELMKCAGAQLWQSGWTGTARLQQWIGDAETKGTWEVMRTSLAAPYASPATAGNDLHLMDSIGTTFDAGAGDDLVWVRAATIS
ncbi:MAG: hypothetical protein IPI44_01390 [Sulfuritalea sp.]|nr:hypothetical protein [Sulfuritalea sp.]